jgi:deoxyribodipyrimidine photolyase
LSPYLHFGKVSPLAIALEVKKNGGDANGFAGVAWCFGKHDRPWARHEVYGTIRYMNDKGLRRKFEVDGFAKRVRALERSLAGMRAIRPTRRWM